MRMDFAGFEDVEAAIRRDEQRVKDALPKMLEAAAAILIPVYKSEIQERYRGVYHGRVRSTGAMREGVRKSKIKVKNARTSIDVWPGGKDSHDVRNAEKAFVLHYGRMVRGRIHRSEWMNAANDEARERVESAMRRIWEESASE